MIAFLADEDFPYPSVQALRAHGHDVVTLSEVGLAGVGTPDTQVLGEATDAGRAVLTLNRRHFAALHASDPTHAGIVTCTYDPDFLALAERIAAAVAGEATLRSRLLVIRRPNPPV